MLSKFFIHRPIFACVIAIVTVVAGLVSVSALPVAQYPEISPPTVKVTCAYPGANSQVVAETVAAPIEQEVNGVEGMLYMSSTSAADGSYALTVTFDIGTDLDMASVLVQNRVAIATPKLPEEVRAQGITTKKQSTSIIQLVSLVSSNPRHDDVFLSNYATINVKDALSRINGVGDVFIFGAGDYSMRVWLNPEQLKSRGITTQDVVAALREQNVQVAAGQIGEPPTPETQANQFTVITLGRLTDEKQFENIVLKTGSDGAITRLADVARIELGAKTYVQSARMTGQPSACLAIYQLPGANALNVAAQVKAVMDGLQENFPSGMSYEIPFDTTLFVDQSIKEVYVTLLEATLLVFITIFIFLQDWRATLVPSITIPVSLVGTFAVMVALGFSINMLTLFGLVLAIGIVVDDAIVVVENTTRRIDVDKMSPRDAAVATMMEVTGPVVATTLVLLAVFVPTAFMAGITGQMYRQFALTIAVSTVFSSINALTLSPALSAILLRGTPTRQNAFFRAFNRVFEKTTNGYTSLVSATVKHYAIALIIFVGLLGITGVGFQSLPTGFLPIEDQGYAMLSVQLPDASSLTRTQQFVEELEGILKETPGVEDWVVSAGYSLLDQTNTSNAATAWVIYKSWEERGAGLSQDAILADLRRRVSSLQEAVVFPFVPPAIQGLGTSGGFQMELQDRGNVGPQALQQMVQEIVQDGNSQSGLQSLNTTFRASVPQLFADVDREKAKLLGLPLNDVFGTLQSFLGSTYVNDFNRFGRVYQVKVQADQQFRMKPEDINRLEVRNLNGDMIPVGTLVDITDTFGPQVIKRYNLYPSASVNGAAAAGKSSGEALTLMEQLAGSKLSSNFDFEWTGMSYQEKKVGSEALVIFALAFLLVYLVLAAQYESWTIPVAVIMAVPLALLGAVIALKLRGMDNNVYTQIGIVLLIALASKNAILIVEFSKELRESGKSPMQAAIEAARLRFRPILMTSFSFILGVIPLVIATGAGAASRQSLGTVVFGGMVAATFFSVMFVPVSYSVVQGGSEWLGRLWRREKSSSDGPQPKPASTPKPAGEAANESTKKAEK